MIRSFRDPRTEALFNDLEVPRYRAIERVARRKLLRAPGPHQCHRQRQARHRRRPGPAQGHESVVGETPPEADMSESTKTTRYTFQKLIGDQDNIVLFSGSPLFTGNEVTG